MADLDMQRLHYWLRSSIALSKSRCAQRIYIGKSDIAGRGTVLRDVSPFDFQNSEVHCKLTVDYFIAIPVGKQDEKSSG
jgi:hypothetical protein